MPIKIAIEQIKQQAKDYKKLNNTKHTKALNEIANLYGFNKFEVLKDKANKNGGFIEINLNDSFVNKMNAMFDKSGQNQNPYIVGFLKSTHGSIFGSDAPDIDMCEYLNSRGVKLISLPSKENETSTKEYQTEIYKYAVHFFEELEKENNNLNSVYSDYSDFFTEWTGNFNGIMSKASDICICIMQLPGYPDLVKSIKEKHGFDLSLTPFIKTSSTKDLKNIDDESKRVIESNTMSRYFLIIDEYDSFPSEEKTYFLHGGSSKICYCEICLRKRESPLYDIFKLFDIADKSNSKEEFLIEIGKAKKDFKELSLFRSERIEKFFEFYDIIQKKLSTILENNTNELVAYQKILTFISHMKVVVISKTKNNIDNVIYTAEFTKEILNYNPDGILVDGSIYENNKEAMKEIEKRGFIVSRIE